MSAIWSKGLKPLLIVKTGAALPGVRERRGDYERRLPIYASSTPARFAIEVAGGRLAQLGLGVGDRVPLDAEALGRQVR